MISGTEIRALDAALENADRTLAQIDAAYRSWRNALSYVGWEDEETRRARLAVEKAHAEREAIVAERNALMESPDHEAWAALVERTHVLARSDLAQLIEREGRGSNLGAILAREVVTPALDNAGQVAEAAAKAAADALKKAGKALPWWAWAGGAVVVLVALAPTINTAVRAGARR